MQPTVANAPLQSIQTIRPYTRVELSIDVGAD